MSTTFEYGGAAFRAFAESSRVSLAAAGSSVFAGGASASSGPLVLLRATDAGTLVFSRGTGEGSTADASVTAVALLHSAAPSLVVAEGAQFTVAVFDRDLTPKAVACEAAARVLAASSSPDGSHM